MGWFAGVVGLSAQILSFPCLVVCVCVGGPALITKDKVGIVSYKAPWGAGVAPRTLEQTGMYEASANLWATASAADPLDWLAL